MAVIKRRGLIQELPTAAELQRRINDHAVKIGMFKAAGYDPHLYQMLIHTDRSEIRSAEAGRRGGKTFGIAWEAAWLSHPEYGEAELRAFPHGVLMHDVDKGRPIHGCIVTPDRKNFSQTHEEYLNALDQMFGWTESNGYEVMRSGGSIERVYIPSKEDAKVIVYMMGAQDPKVARGNYFHWRWYDEGAAYPGDRFHEALDPAVAGINGVTLMSTTPSDDALNRWYFDRFIDPKQAKNLDIYTCQWLSVENPYFSKRAWATKKATLGRIAFLREYCASWDLPTSAWLRWESIRWFDWREMHHVPGTADANKCKQTLDRSRYSFVAGVDPAARIANRNDYTAVAIVAIDQETYQGYLVELHNVKLRQAERDPDKDDQIKLLLRLWAHWNLTYIGIEDATIGITLQDHLRAHPAFRGSVVGIKTKGTSAGAKEERIASMEPVFATGQMRVTKDLMNDSAGGAPGWFEEQWTKYPVVPHDDALDAISISIKTAIKMGMASFNGATDMSLTSTEDDEDAEPDMTGWSNMQINIYRAARRNYGGRGDTDSPIMGNRF